MKKKNLKLRIETVRHMSPENLREVNGGLGTLYCTGYCTVPCVTQRATCMCTPNCPQ